MEMAPLPNKPVAGLHIPQHEGLQLRLLEDGCLVLDIRVEPLEKHGEARELLQLDVVLPLHHGVQAVVIRPQGRQSVFFSSRRKLK
jgi:hypothetical protein